MKRSVNEYDENRGGGGKVFRAMEEYGGPAALAGSGAAGYADYRLSKQKEQDKSEADAEMKRESRGVKKPANFDAMQESIQDAKDRANARKQDAAYNKAMPSPYKKGGAVKKYSKGGVTRADGIAKKGHTRGRMI